MSVAGNTTYANTNTFLVGNNVIVLDTNLGSTVAPFLNAGIVVNRGNKNSNAAITWIESVGAWAFTSNTLNAYTTYFASNTYVDQSTANANGYSSSVGVNANNWSNTQTYVTNYQTANYILLGTDIGKLVVANGPNVFVTANTFTPGQNIFLYNNTAANVTITQNTSVTLYLPGNPASTGNRTMLQRGFATLTCVLANTFVVTGTGVV